MASSIQFGHSIPSTGSQRINLLSPHDPNYPRQQNYYTLPTPQNNAQTAEVVLTTNDQTIAGNKTFSGNTSTSGNESVGGALTVTGAATIGGALNVTGQANFQTTIVHQNGTASLADVVASVIDTANPRFGGLSSLQGGTFSQSTSITTTVDASSLKKSFFLVFTQAASAAAGGTHVFDITLPTSLGSHTFSKNLYGVMAQITGYGGTGIPIVHVSTGTANAIRVTIRNIHATDSLSASMVIFFLLVAET